MVASAAVPLAFGQEHPNAGLRDRDAPRQRDAHVTAPRQLARLVGPRVPGYEDREQDGREEDRTHENCETVAGP